MARTDFARQRALTFLTDRAQVLRSPGAPATAGGAWTQTRSGGWQPATSSPATDVDLETVQTDLPCALQTYSTTGSTELRSAGGGIEAQARWVVFVPAGTDVRPEDRLLINGRTYYVEQPRRGPGTLDLLEEWLCSTQS